MSVVYQIYSLQIEDVWCFYHCSIDPPYQEFVNHSPNLGQIWPTECFCTVSKLRMYFIFYIFLHCKIKETTKEYAIEGTRLANFIIHTT